MKKDALKSNLTLFLLCIAGNTLAVSSDIQTRNMALYAKLIVGLGPERAKEFKNRLEQKHSKIEVSKPIPAAPTKPFIPQPEPPITKSPDPVTIQPPMAPAAPVVKVWISDVERENFNATVDHLQLYMGKVYDCLNDFFNRSNHEPYRHHVNCFRTQLKFLQTLFPNYPQGETPAGNLLFTALKKIAVSLEKCQELMVQTLDRDYPNITLGALALGTNMQQIESPVNQQRNIINQQIGILRNELRKAQATEMLQSINKLNTQMNIPFDYAKTKNFQELLGSLTHRVKK
jgi:hypothetical protein